MATDEIDVTCGPCSSRNVSNKAMVWCPLCEEGLCEQCLEYHKVSRSSRQHETWSIESYLQFAPFVQTINQTCELHEESLALYCPTHQEPCCTECISYDHAHCPGVTLLSKIVKGISKSEYFSVVDKNIRDTKKTIETMRQNREANRERLEKQRVQLKRDVQKFHKELLSHIDLLVNKLNSDIDSHVDQEFANVKSADNLLDDQLFQINIDQEHISILAEHGSDIQIYLGIRKIDKAIAEKAEKFKNSMDTDSMKEINISLNLEQNFENLLKIDKIGSPKVSKVLVDLELASLTLAKAQFTSDVVDFEKVKLHHIQWILFPNPDHELNITSVCVVSEDKIIFVSSDFNRDKGELYVYGLDGTFQRVLRCISRPFGISALGPNTFAVSFHNDKCLHVFDTNDFTCKCKTAKGYTHWGLSSSESQLVSAVRGTGISVINFSGKTLKVFPVDFMGLAYVHYTGQNIYYTDFHCNVLYCLDANGEHIWEATFDDMKGPRNICTDHFGNIFVASMDSNKVLVISRDGKLCKTLLSFDQPKAPCYDKTKFLLVVAGRKGTVSLYNVLYD